MLQGSAWRSTATVRIVLFPALGVSQPCSRTKLALARAAGWLQKEIPFRINSPTKTCAVARSFVMSSILHFNFYLQRRKVKARRGGCTSIHG